MKKVISLLIVISFILIGCEQSTVKQIEGVWKTSDDCATHLGEGLKFQSDGSVSVMNGEPYISWELNEQETKMFLSNSNYGIYDTYEFKMIDENTMELVKENYALECQLTRE